jgi:hypothetical protein
VGAVLTTTALPLAAAPRNLADPSKITADPVGHLALLAAVVLAIVGYLLYRRSRDKRDSRHIDENNHPKGHDDQRGHHH